MGMRKALHALRRVSDGLRGDTEETAYTMMRAEEGVIMKEWNRAMEEWVSFLKCLWIFIMFHLRSPNREWHSHLRKGALYRDLIRAAIVGVFDLGGSLTTQHWRVES